MALIFISHSSQDNEKIEPIIKIIKENNFDSIFLDFDEQDGIHAGEKWEKRIYSEIQRSHVMLVLFSPAWIASKWCFAEYRLAKSLGKEIIPIIIENGEHGEIDKWIENNIQKSDFTKDKEVLNRVITRIRDISMETQKGFKWDRNRLPYPGLLSFEEEDAPIFFGRERDSKIIIERLNSMSNNSSSKLLNIVSASGLGKSSLLKAGVIPKLKLSYHEKWKVLEVLRPTGRPLYEFTKLISKTLGKQDNYKILYEGLKSEQYQEVLDDVLTELEFLSVKKKSILLPIDQVEEFYTIADREEKKIFFRVLEYLLDKKEIFFTIWTLRSDFLKEFQVDTFGHTLHRYEEVYSLSAISKEDIGSIIKEPAYVAGVNIEEKLLAKIKEDIQSTDALPILALCLNELYERYAKNGSLSLVDYQHLAKSEMNNPMENIIRRKADDAISKYKDDLESLTALKNAFIPHMVRINTQNKYVQKDALLSDLPEESYEILETLVKARLLVKKNINGEVRIEVAHEALIRKWSLLQQWLKDEHEFLISKSRLEIALDEWKKSNKNNKALLGGLQLEKVSFWKERLSEEEITFVNTSLSNKNKKKRKRKQFYIFSFILISLFALISVYNWKKAEGYLLQVHETLEESTIKQALVYRDYLNEPLKAKLLFAKMLDKHEDKNKQRLKILYNSINKNLSLIDIKEHQDKYNGVEASKKHKGQILVWTLDHQVEVWDMIARIKLCSFKHEKSITGATFIEDENFILSWSDDGNVKLFDRVNGVVKKVYHHDDKVYGVSLKKETNQLLTWAGNKVYLWDKRDEKKALKILEHTYEVEGAMFSKKNQKIITWSNKHIKIWNILDNSFIEFIHDGLVKGVLLNDNETKLLSWGEDNSLRLWSLQDGTELRHFRHTSTVNGASFSQNEQQLLSWSEDGTIRLWSILKNKELNRYKHKGSVRGAVFYANETEILAWGGEESSQSGEVKLWNVKTGEKLLSIMHNSAVYVATLNKDKNMIESWSSNWNTKIAEIRKWQIKEEMKSPITEKFKVIIHEDNQLVFKNSKELKVYDKEGNKLQVFKHYLNINGAFFNKKRDKVVTWSDDTTVKLWSVKDGRQLLMLKHNQAVRGVVFNKDETLILSWTDNRVQLWDMHENMLLSFVKKDIVNLRFNAEETAILMLDTKNRVTQYSLYPKSNLNQKSYLLEIAINNGISLTEAGEVSVLNSEEWKAKKEAYRKLK